LPTNWANHCFPQIQAALIGWQNQAGKLRANVGRQICAAKSDQQRQAGNLCRQKSHQHNMPAKVGWLNQADKFSRQDMIGNRKTKRKLSFIGIANIN